MNPEGVMCPWDPTLDLPMISVLFPTNSVEKQSKLLHKQATEHLQSDEHQNVVTLDLYDIFKDSDIQMGEDNSEELPDEILTH